MTKTEEKRLARQVNSPKEKDGSLRDKIKALREENKALKRSLAETEKILFKMPGAFALIQEGTIVLANETFLKEVGFSEEELLGLDFRQFIHPDYVDEVMGFYRNRISGRPAPGRYEANLITKNKEALYCEIRVSRIRYFGKRAFIVKATSLEPIKEKESRRIESAKREIFFSMAEGFRGYLRDCLKQLKRHLELFEPGERRFKSGFKEAEKGLQSLEEETDILMRDLEVLVRGYSEDRPKEVFDVKETVRDALKLARKTWKTAIPSLDSKVKVSTYLRSLSPVEGYPGDFRDAVSKIILNAAEAMPDGGEIHLTTEEQAGFAYIYVQDSGKGIREDIVGRVFDPFFTTKEASGRGLGLGVARAIVHTHGGMIEVLNHSEGGCTFAISIPLATEDQLSKSEGPKNLIRDSRVLLVAKEGILKDLLAQILNDKGCLLVETSAATQALSILKKGAFDLLIADLDVPDLVVSKIVPKAKESRHRLPVVLIDGGGRGIRQKGKKNLQADLVIERPLEMDRIHSLLSQILER